MIRLTFCEFCDVSSVVLFGRKKLCHKTAEAKRRVNLGNNNNYNFIIKQQILKLHYSFNVLHVITMQRYGTEGIHAKIIRRWQQREGRKIKNRKTRTINAEEGKTPSE